MQLYHGSLEEVASPEIREPNRRLDFGAGFYTTTNFDQAKRWAIVRKERGNSHNAFVSIYEVPTDFLSNTSMRIMIFPTADEIWLDFVIKNRADKLFKHNYDIVKGAVANDKVFASINAFENGFMDKTTLLKELMAWKYVDQISFHTQRALTVLKFLRSEII